MKTKKRKLKWPEDPRVKRYNTQREYGVLEWRSSGYLIVFGSLYPHFTVMLNGSLKEFKTLAAAKAACQRHYERGEK